MAAYKVAPELFGILDVRKRIDLMDTESGGECKQNDEKGCLFR